MDNDMYSLRILSKGKIENLSGGFSLNGVPFSIYVRPKKVTMEHDTLVNCRLLCDKEVSEFPVPINDWTPAMIAEISPDAISLSDFDVYWGAGEKI